ncbi:MAG TPA: efflux RND transporter periplasmic adaptor subunit [Usitatibacter sp.]|nr:efflux RND transporter periplasmic adaptor subunit [Usitatibacter sp.]
MNDVPSHGTRARRWPWILAAAIAAVLALAGWKVVAMRSQEKGPKRAQAVSVVTARAESRDVPVRLKANGTVTALQSVDIRAQVTDTVRQVHIREGQDVAAGQLLISLDSRADDANIHKAEAQVEKDKADLANAKRNLERNADLFKQKFIAQAALDTAQNAVDTLGAQLGVDTAALESARVARGYDEIRAPFAGRTGTIGVREGSLVQPGSGATPGAIMVTVTQIDPISVSFTIPERELPGLQGALRTGNVSVRVAPQDAGEKLAGKITFVDNAVDSATGTIRVKANFANASTRLWPGQYVNVELAPRTLTHATVVPAQAVQTGPDNRFVYVVGPDSKVAVKEVKLAYVDEGIAVVDGVAPGARVVVEGAQNLRPGSAVTEGKSAEAS